MPRSVDTDVQVLPSGLAVHSRVDLTADNNVASAPGFDHRVNWLRDSDGGLVASIGGGWGTTGAPNNIETGLLLLQAFAPILAPGGTPQAEADLYLEAQANAAGTLGDAFLTARCARGSNVAQRQIISDTDQSDFPILDHCQVFSSAGPVPVSWNVNITNPTALIAIAGSMWDTVVGRHNGLPIFFNGVQIGGFDFYFNNANVHTTIPPRFFKVTGLTPGVKVLSVNASGSSVTTDAQDLFFALVIN